ncbi:hypothetical protein EDC01DRAFT_633021 [Geopyxis carbonaria]|nr:hypothetical protein EDC01DRAFT_633021 [Geopyxis carbonaria]
MLTTTDHTDMSDHKSQTTVSPAPRRRRNATISIFTPPPTTTTVTQPARATRPRAPSNIPRYRGVNRPLPRRVAQLRAGHAGAEAPMRSTREERWRAVRTGWEPIEIGDEVERHGEGDWKEEWERGQGGRGGGKRWEWVAAVLWWVWAWGWVAGFLWWAFAVG